MNLDKIKSKVQLFDTLTVDKLSQSNEKDTLNFSVTARGTEKLFS